MRSCLVSQLTADRIQIKQLAGGRGQGPPQLRIRRGSSLSSQASGKSARDVEWQLAAHFSMEGFTSCAHRSTHRVPCQVRPGGQEHPRCSMIPTAHPRGAEQGGWAVRS